MFKCFNIRAYNLLQSDCVKFKVIQHYLIKGPVELHLFLFVAEVQYILRLLHVNNIFLLQVLFTSNYLKFLQLLESVILQFVVHLQLLFQVLGVRFQFLAGGQSRGSLFSLVFQLRLHITQLFLQPSSFLLARLFFCLTNNYRLLVF